jgi:hypothetical protein
VIPVTVSKEDVRQVFMVEDRDGGSAYGHLVPLSNTVFCAVRHFESLR